MVLYYSSNNPISKPHAGYQPSMKENSFIETLSDMIGDSGFGAGRYSNRLVENSEGESTAVVEPPPSLSEVEAEMVSAAAQGGTGNGKYLRDSSEPGRRQVESYKQRHSIILNRLEKIENFLLLTIFLLLCLVLKIFN